MTQLPLWAVYAVAFGTPASAFFGLLINVWLTHRLAGQNDRRAEREEVLRNLRWAAELAASDHEVRRRVGVGQLLAWGRAVELTALDQVFVDAALASVLAPVEAEIDEATAGRRRLVVVELPDPSGIHSDPEDETDGSDDA